MVDSADHAQAAHGHPLIMVVYQSRRPPPALAAALIEAGHSVVERQVADGCGLEGNYDVSVVVASADPSDPRDREMLQQITIARPGALLLVVAPLDSDATHVTALSCGALCCLSVDLGPTAIAAHAGALARLSVAGHRRSAAHDLAVGDVSIDFARRQVRVAGRLVELTRGEFDILAVLAGHLGTVLSPQDILSLGGQPGISAPHARDIVKAHVCRLRQKLRIAPGDAAILQTVRGVGYVLERRGIADHQSTTKSASSSGHRLRDLVPA